MTDTKGGAPAGGRGFLSPYRVLDLSDHRGLLAGHMFAQLGADVIQVEPTTGSTARRHPPFAPDWPEGENSFYWAAYSSGKRGIVCDPEHPEGRDLFHRLLGTADFLFESRAPGDGRPDWLDPAQVAKINPRIVHVSITPFGLDGPKAGWADSEIMLWAAGGPLLPTRGPDDRPLRISAPQAYLHAAGDAAGAALIAHFERRNSDLGQHVDIAVMQSVPQATLSAVLAAAVDHPAYTPRPKPPGNPGEASAPDTGMGSARMRRSKWPVADGLAEMHVAEAPAVAQSTNALFALMRERGALDPRFHDWDWTTLGERIASGEIGEAELDLARDAVIAFTRTLGKADLMGIAMEKGVRVAPVRTMRDLLDCPHAAERGFYQVVKGPFGDYVLPGDFAFGQTDGFVPLRPAPRLGEHQQEVLRELGLEEARR